MYPDEGLMPFDQWLTRMLKLRKKANTPRKANEPMNPSEKWKNWRRSDLVWINYEKFSLSRG